VKSADNIVDVTVDNLGKVFVIDSEGTIFNISGSKLGKQFYKTDLGDNCRIEGFNNGSQLIYTLNSKGELFEISSNSIKTIQNSQFGVDLCVDFKSTLYLATSSGIFAKKAAASKFTKVSNEKVSSIGCAWVLWFIGIDGYVYKSPII
jgi:hypothetical protein